MNRLISFGVVVTFFGVLFFFMFRGFADDERARCTQLFHQARTHSDSLVVGTTSRCSAWYP